MTAARGFARYLAGIDENTEVPPLGLMPNRQRWRRPFIFTPGDIEAVMSQARTTIESPLRAATYDTLIGLLATAGLRIGEAIKLDRSDVDWDQSVLLIRESKFGKSRLVPLHVSSVNALAEFAALREDLQPHPNVASFFMSLTRNRLSYAVVQETFRRLVDSAGVGAGAPSPPRLHDLRHSSPSRPCSVGIETTRTSKRRSRHCRPTSSVANQPRPTGICLLPGAAVSFAQASDRSFGMSA
jgi:integrase